MTRQARLLDLAIQGLYEFSGHSMVDREDHIEPLLYASMDLHVAVRALEQRLDGVMIPIPRDTATPA